MSHKVKHLGFGLLAVIAMSGFAAMNASAVTGGHFTHDAPTVHATITGTEIAGTNHVIHFVIGEGSVGCDEKTYHGLMTSKTTQTLKITPDWNKCYTTGDVNKTPITIHENGCYFEFKSGKTGEAHHTNHFICPTKPLEITHPNCTMRLPTQTLRGLTYAAIFVNSKHALTVSSTSTGVTTHYEGGICVFLGTAQALKMEGSITVEANDTAGNPVNLTQTTGA